MGVFELLYRKLNDYTLVFPMAGLLRLIVFKLKDLLTKKDKSLRIYGIYGYFGLWGQGKTIAMTKELLELRQKYKDEIYIATNYGFELQDFAFTEWQQLLKKYDKPLIVAWDEVQNEFTSRNFKTFPVQLLTVLTQNRKGNGIRILYSAQRWERVDKVFRELTYLCYECKTRLGRITGIRGYDWEDYEQLKVTKQVESKLKIHPKKRKVFVQTDYLRSLFDSFKMLESAKSKDLLGLDELKGRE